jgi:hypothetical protein
MPSLLAADSAARSVELKRMEAVARSFVVVGVSLMVCTGRTPPRGPGRVASLRGSHDVNSPLAFPYMGHAW